MQMQNLHFTHTVHENTTRGNTRTTAAAGTHLWNLKAHFASVCISALTPPFEKKKKKATDSLTMYMQNLPAQASKTEHEVKCPFYWSQEQSFAFFASQAKCSSSTVRLIDHKRILFCQLATVSQWIWMWRPMYKACVHTAQMQHCLSLTSLAHCNCQSTGPIEFT